MTVATLTALQHVVRSFTLVIPAVVRDHPTDGGSSGHGEAMENGHEIDGGGNASDGDGSDGDGSDGDGSVSGDVSVGSTLMHVLLELLPTMQRCVDLATLQSWQSG